MPTYGGDEVNALVIDVGSTWTRAGFAGEDLPRAYFPSHVGYVESEVELSEAVDEPKENGKAAGSDVEMADASADGAQQPSSSSPSNAAEKDKDAGSAQANGGRGAAKNGKVRKYFVGDTESATWRSGMEVRGPLEQGLVTDWDIYEKIWEYAFKSRLRVRPEEHPVMVSEAAWNTAPLRGKLVEMAFEKFNCPAFYVCKNPVLAAFGTGKHTGLVVDVGGEMTSACAVYEGFCLTKTICKQELGGELLSTQILEKLKQENSYDLTPVFDIKTKAPVDTMRQPSIVRHNRQGTTDSYLEDMRLRAVQEFKEAACEIVETPYSAQVASSRPQKPFEFPDGFNLSVGTMRYALPEILFNPTNFMVSRPKRLEGASLMGIHEIAIKSVLASDVDLRPQLLNNIVLAGGSSLFPGYVDRLSYMLTTSIPGSKIKLHAPNTNMERKVTAWLGGSILASLGTFHQLWVSRAEYDEHGASIVEKKCQ